MTGPYEPDGVSMASRARPSIISACHRMSWIASTSAAPRSAAQRRITAAASGRRSPMTTVIPGLMIPAFSNAIAPSVSPRCCWWSKSIVVIAPATGVITLVASKRPPRPTSMTPTSTPERRNSSKAAAVVASKKVGCTLKSARGTQTICTAQHIVDR